MKRRVVLLTGVLAMCGVVPVASAPGAAPATAKAAAQKPAATDGQPRVVERRGKFVIRPDTLFCSQNGRIHPAMKAYGPFYGTVDGVQLREALNKIGQSDYIGGAKRTPMLSSGHCPDNGKNIVFDGFMTLNTTSTPYRLELSARQGAAAGAGSAFVKVVVERADGRSPHSRDIRIMGAAGPNDYISYSIMQDAQLLSEILINRLFER